MFPGARNETTGYYALARDEVPKSIDETGLMVRLGFSENIVGAPINPHVESFFSSFVNGVFVDVIGQQTNARLAPWQLIRGKQDHSPSWIVQRGSFEILAPLFPFRLQIMVIERKERPRGQLDIERWRVSHVGQHETYWHIRKPRWFMKTQRSSDGRPNFNPRSLIRLHGIQLAAHDSLLAASQAGLPSSDTGIGGDYYDTRERHPKHWLVVGLLALFGRAMVLGARDGVASGIVADGGPMTDLGLSGALRSSPPG